jgi:DNA-binding transcriptional ArsR family regulator
MSQRQEHARDIAILPESVPVEMPSLPPRLVVESEQQIKAAFDPLRGRILQLLRERPATAKQLAAQLEVAPSLVVYHLQVLEGAGLACLVAQRRVRGIIAKYYARTAQVFIFDPNREVTGQPPVQLLLLNQARDELLEALPRLGPHDTLRAWCPHVRLSRERMRVYEERLDALVQDFLNEPPDPNGQMHVLFALDFLAPPSLQRPEPASAARNRTSDGWQSSTDGVGSDNDGE